MNSSGRLPNRILPAIFAVSFAVIAWQLGLMRCLLIARYHHFSFLVISCALLGFGAGGTLLSVGRSWMERHEDALFRWLLVSFALSMPVCLRIGETLPLSIYFAPVQMTSTLVWWLLFQLIHGIPFLIAGVFVGFAFIRAGDGIRIVYGCNLAGSAFGALAGVVLLDHVAPNATAALLAIPVLASCVLLLPGAKEPTRRLFPLTLAAAGLLCAGALCLGPQRIFPLSIDQYKMLAYVQRLEQQGAATGVSTFQGVRGRIDLFSGPHFHTLSALSGKEPPPPMDVVLRDGFHVGSVLSITDLKQAAFLKGTLSSIPYCLTSPERVLILGDAGGTYVWLARLSPAKSIVLVQPDENILRILLSHPSRVLDDPRVRVVKAEPRAFLDTSRERFDVIHLAALEGFAAGSSGIGGLREDYLATVEGFRRCLYSLTEKGLACVVRGIQEPERDNIRIAATWIEALERDSASSPGVHLLMARDELNCVTLVSRTPLAEDVTAAFRHACSAMSWDTDWFPGVRPDETNRLHRIPGPSGTRHSWYFHAIEEVLSTRRGGFYADWVADVRPASDDRPFFHDFFRWASLERFREVFGPLWPTRSEMGFLMLLITAAWTALAAVLLLPPAIIQVRRRGDAAPGWVMAGVVAFFAALGTAFMFVEMAFIQLFTRFTGDPVVSAALVLGGMLLFAGVGGMRGPETLKRIPGGMPGGCLAVAILIAVAGWGLPSVFRICAGLPGPGKVVVGLLVTGFPAFLMGMPFPWGLRLLDRNFPGTLPVAWAVNGFASVVATSVAVMSAMVWGFATVLGAAACLYAIAGVLARFLSGRNGRKAA